MSATPPIAVFVRPGPHAGRLRFASADPRLQGLDGALFDSPAAAERLAEAMLAVRGGANDTARPVLPQERGR